MKKFNKGSELDKQIYKEGEPTWGCKSGVLDVEAVQGFIEEGKARISNQLRIHWFLLKDKSWGEVAEFINNIINERAGGKLIK